MAQLDLTTGQPGRGLSANQVLALFAGFITLTISVAAALFPLPGMPVALSQVGAIALYLAFAVAIYSVVASVIGAQKRYGELVESGRNAAFAWMGLVLLSTAMLVIALVGHDFGLQYVAERTSRTQPLVFLITALWGGQEGSLLFWTLVLAGYSFAALWPNRDKQPEMMPYVTAILSTIAVFFIFMVGFLASPFVRLEFVPPDGVGLNPLLMNYWMAIHPPSLYLGFIGWAVPFAIMMASLYVRQKGNDWILLSRRYTLVAWLFLSLGNLFGAMWAYVTLGWGGYWGWDPVENAALMPWLTGTAFIHSVQIQQRRGMLKVWNVLLLIATFSLSIFGTMLTRSGILSSVHSFAASNIGPAFLTFLGVVLIASFSLLFSRLDDLKSENELDSFVSRESAFLYQNVVFLGMAFAVLWGTILPLVSEALRGTKMTVGPPFFKTVNGPMLGLAMILMGVAPLMAWRRTTLKNLVRNFSYPLFATLFLTLLLFALGIRDPYVLIFYAFSAFVGGTILLEFFRGTRARHRSQGEPWPVAFARLVSHNKPRYGGYIVHLGSVLIAIGVVASHAYQLEKDLTLRPGQAAQIGQFTLTYQGLQQSRSTDKTTVFAQIDVAQDGRSVGQLLPARNFYRNREEEPQTEVALRISPTEDLYLVLAGWEDDGLTTIRAWVNPMVVWIWIGGAVLILGTLLAFLTNRRDQQRLRPAYEVGIREQRPGAGGLNPDGEG